MCKRCFFSRCFEFVYKPFLVTLWGFSWPMINNDTTQTTTQQAQGRPAGYVRALTLGQPVPNPASWQSKTLTQCPSLLSHPINTCMRYILPLHDLLMAWNENPFPQSHLNEPSVLTQKVVGGHLSESSHSSISEEIKAKADRE